MSTSPYPFWLKPFWLKSDRREDSGPARVGHSDLVPVLCKHASNESGMASILIPTLVVSALLHVLGSAMPHKRSKFRISQRSDAPSATAHDAITQAEVATQLLGINQTSDTVINPSPVPISFMPMLLTPEEVYEVQFFINNLIAKRAQSVSTTPPTNSVPCTPRVCHTEFLGSEDDDPADADSIYGSQHDIEWLAPLPSVPQFPVAGSVVGASSATLPAHPLHSNPCASCAEETPYTVSNTSVLATLTMVSGLTRSHASTPNFALQILLSATRVPRVPFAKRIQLRRYSQTLCRWSSSYGQLPAQACVSTNSEMTPPMSR